MLTQKRKATDVENAFLERTPKWPKFGEHSGR